MASELIATCAIVDGIFERTIVGVRAPLGILRLIRFVMLFSFDQATKILDQNAQWPLQDCE